MKKKRIFQSELVSDEQFCDILHLTVDLERKIACCIRSQMAVWYKCSPEEFSPNLKTRTILNSRWAPITGEDVLGDIEDSVSKIADYHIEINPSNIQPFTHRGFFGLFRKKGATTFGEWVNNLTQYIVNQIKEERKGR